MHRFFLKDTKGNPVDLLCPTSLSEVTLAQWQAYTALSGRESEIEEMEGYDRDLMEEDDRDLFDLEVKVKKADLLRDRIKCLIPESEHGRLDRLGIPDLNALDSSMLDKPKGGIVTEFFFPPAIQPDLAEFNAKMGGLSFWERRKARKTAKEIALGKFTLVPVAEVQLRARMALDLIQSKSRSGPPEELQAWMDEQGLGVQTLAQAIMASIPTTPDEERDKLRRTRLLNKWGRELEAGEFKSMHKLISHLCVPAHDPVYDPAKAMEREPYFLQLPMDTVLGVRDFFVMARKGLQLPSRTFSSLTRNQTPPPRD